MYDRDNLQCMIDCLEENRYAYTNYSHRNGCCSINSDLLLKQLKLNEKEIRAKAIDELKKRFRADFEEMMANNMEDCINWADWLDATVEELKGGAE